MAFFVLGEIHQGPEHLQVGDQRLHFGDPVGKAVAIVVAGLFEQFEAGPAEAAPFASRRQRKTTVVMVLRHLRHLSQQLGESPATWEPIFSIAEQGGSEWADARDWCTGFLQAVDLRPEAWGDPWNDAAAAPGLAPLLVDEEK